jgi:hypothetical protein
MPSFWRIHRHMTVCLLFFFSDHLSDELHHGRARSSSPSAGHDALQASDAKLRAPLCWPPSCRPSPQHCPPLLRTHDGWAPAATASCGQELLPRAALSHSRACPLRRRGLARRAAWPSSRGPAKPLLPHEVHQQQDLLCAHS